MLAKNGIHNGIYKAKAIYVKVKEQIEYVF